MLVKTTSLTIQKEQFERMQQDIGHHTEVTSHILQTHTDHEVVALGGLVPTGLQAILEETENTSFYPNQQCCIKLSAQMNQIIKTLDLDLILSPQHTCKYKQSKQKVCYEIVDKMFKWKEVPIW